MNYYNEFDPKAAAWLRELINQKLIPNGHIDTRSICDVRPEDLNGFNQCHFFAGIGGWPLALQLAEVSPDEPVWTGSCPCQPFSVAGLGKGTADERHLWPEFFRLIRERRPARVFGEQVASKAALGWLDGVFADLENEDYACGAADMCAAGVGAPHIRQRLFWVADSERNLRTNGEGSRGWCPGRMGRVIEPVPWNRTWQCALSEFRAVDDGLSSHGMAICCGARNAIVPQIASEFIIACMEASA